MTNISFENQVAIVTGAGNGLGRSHALALAKRGAKVVVNDLGGARDGTGGSLSAAEEVVEEIRQAGGEAIANGANVTNEQQINDMVEKILSDWGRVDILINNAGILRDKSFAKMPMDDFRAVIDVHLTGSAICTKAVWEPMRTQQYGRVLVTSSPSGLYGIFGQANYSAAKAGLIGFMNALSLEGAKYNININAIAPTAATRMTEDLGIPEPVLKQMTPEAITAAVLYLVSKEAPTKTIISCAGGGYAMASIAEADGIYLAPDQQTPEDIAENFKTISDQSTVHYYQDSNAPNMNFLGKAMKHQNKE